MVSRLRQHETKDNIDQLTDYVDGNRATQPLGRLQNDPPEQTMRGRDGSRLSSRYVSQSRSARHHAERT
jgi:hypothetical protein